MKTISEQFDERFVIHSKKVNYGRGTHTENYAKWQGIHLEPVEFVGKIKQFYNKKLAELEKENRILRAENDNHSQTIAKLTGDLKKEHDIYCDELVKQNNMVLNKTIKEMADDIINAIKDEDDWLEMHKIESKFESGKSVGVARALALAETVIKKYIWQQHKKY